jgi:hypothetical protein
VKSGIIASIWATSLWSAAFCCRSWALRRARSVSFIRKRDINPVGILRLVFVPNGIAFVVITLADQPAEDPGRIGRVGNAAFIRLAIPCGDVVFGNRPPEAVAPAGLIGPALDPREQSFDSGTIATNSESDPIDRDRLVINDVLTVFHHPVSGILFELRRQLFHPGEDEDIGFLMISILGQPLVGFSRNGGKRKVPAEAEGAIAGAGIIREGKWGPEAGAAGAGGDGNRHRAGSGDRIGGELLADTADGAAPFWEREGGRGIGILVRGGVLPAFFALAFSSGIGDHEFFRG